MMVQDRWDREEEREGLLEGIFAIVDPERFKRWSDERRMRRVEQGGVERVTYMGEEGSEEDIAWLDLSIVGASQKEVDLTGGALGDYILKGGYDS